MRFPYLKHLVFLLLTFSQQLSYSQTFGFGISGGQSVFLSPDISQPGDKYNDAINNQSILLGLNVQICWPDLGLSIQTGNYFNQQNRYITSLQIPLELHFVPFGKQCKYFRTSLIAGTNFNALISVLQPPSSKTGAQSYLSLRKSIWFVPTYGISTSFDLGYWSIQTTGLLMYPVASTFRYRTDYRKGLSLISERSTNRDIGYGFRIEAIHYF